MAGIAGIIGGSPQKADVRTMLRTLKHRGADALGFYDGADAVIGVCQAGRGCENDCARGDR